MLVAVELCPALALSLQFSFPQWRTARRACDGRFSVLRFNQPCSKRSICGKIVSVLNIYTLFLVIVY